MKKFEFDELIERAFSEGYRCAQKEFGMKSKLLGGFLPGAYQAKEAAKYAHEDDEEEYKNNRAKYALLGAMTPLTATVIKKKVEQMKKDGASPAEIRKYLENGGAGRIAAGVGEVAAGVLSNGMTTWASNLTATGAGLADAITGNRAKPRRKDEDDENDED